MCPNFRVNIAQYSSNWPFSFKFRKLICTFNNYFGTHHFMNRNTNKITRTLPYFIRLPDSLAQPLKPTSGASSPSCAPSTPIQWSVCKTKRTTVILADDGYGVIIAKDAIKNRDVPINMSFNNMVMYCLLLAARNLRKVIINISNEASTCFFCYKANAFVSLVNP